MENHRTGGGRGGEHSEVTDNFTSLVYIGDSKKTTLVHRLREKSKTEQKGSDGETACSLYVRVASEIHFLVSIKNVFDGSDLEEEKLREAQARHGQCWKKDEVEPSVAVAGVKKVLVPR